MLLSLATRISRRCSRINSSRASSSSAVPLSALCVPTTPPYSIRALLASTPPTPVPDAVLRKLHTLSALPYPSCTSEDLAGLIGIIEGIRGEEVTRLLHEAGEQDLAWGRKEVLIDGKEEDAGEMAPAEANVEPRGRTLLESASRTSGIYYVVDSAKVKKDLN